jgi:predicted TIM-barrel fold metal-dependent hydrolase
MTPDELREVRILAVDLGLRCGWAAFGAAGRLFGYGSRHFGTRAMLRKAVPRILEQFPNLDLLVVEGGGDLFVPWEKEAARRNVTVKQVMGEEWRKTILLPSQRRSGENAKAAADGLAREVIERAGAKRPTSLRHDAAEAILVGAWAASALRSPRAGSRPEGRGGRR